MKIQEHMKITRIWQKTSAAWPREYLKKIDLAEIIAENNYDADEEQLERNKRDAKAGKYGGCTPWIKVEFSQDLSAKSIFAVGVLLRYASEHGAVLKVLEYMEQMDLKIPREKHFTIASMLGNAGGHAIGHWTFAVEKHYKKRVMKFSWADAFLTMEKQQKPFWEQPNKNGNIDPFFTVNDSGRYEPGRKEIFGSYIHMSPLTRNGISLQTFCNDADAVINAMEAA
jgi:hypothetical protein